MIPGKETWLPAPVIRGPAEDELPVELPVRPETVCAAAISIVNVPWNSFSRKSESGFAGSEGGNLPSAQITPASEEVMSRTPESVQVVAFVRARSTVTVLSVIFDLSTAIPGPV